MPDASPKAAALAPAGAAQMKKNICDRTSKAKRVKFYRNGDTYHPGVIIPVSRERFRSFDIMCDELTKKLKNAVEIPGAVRNIFTMNGKRIVNLEELQDGESYICSCNTERFKKGNYKTSAEPANKRRPPSRRASLPLKKREDRVNSNQAARCIKNCIEVKPEALRDNLADVKPRLVVLIRNGPKPRSIMRLLLNKRNSPSFEQVLVTITNLVHLDTGCVRKVFTLSGQPVKILADFFGEEVVFLVYGKERVNYDTDFIFDKVEEKVMCKLRIAKPKKTIPHNEQKIAVGKDIDEAKLPPFIRERYVLEKILGKGAFGLVVKIKKRDTGFPYALKIIDKSNYKGMKHYLDAERCILTKMRHPHTVSLIFDLDYRSKSYLILDYVDGGDLADVIFRKKTLSEEQARLIIKQLAAAMKYLHAMRIIHRDIKPANLLVELDSNKNVVNVKLGDFGLAYELRKPVSTYCGTPAYMAPEVAQQKGYGLKVDIWSAGIVLYTVLVGIEPAAAYGADLKKMYDAYKAGQYVYPKHVEVSTGAKDLIRKMLEYKPENRISSNEVLTHYWTKSS